MSRNVAKTSGAVEGRRQGDASLFFSENRDRTLFQMPWAYGERKVQLFAYPVILFFCFLSVVRGRGKSHS